MKENLPVKFLSDDPTDTDDFGSHSKVAKALAQTIDNQEGGKRIALFGSWGSGKSTVIKLLKKLFKENVENQFKYINLTFVFDAWSHKGDPLKRIFLEELYNFLKQHIKIGTKKDKEIEKELNTLSQRTETKVTKTKPVLTGEGKLLIFSIFICPIVFAFLNIIDSTTLAWDEVDPI